MIFKNAFLLIFNTNFPSLYLGLRCTNLIFRNMFTLTKPHLAVTPRPPGPRLCVYVSTLRSTLSVLYATGLSSPALHAGEISQARQLNGF